MALRLRVLAVLSSILLLWQPSPARAHEVTPTIVDFGVEEGQITLSLRMNLEAFVLGIDLDGMLDVNASDLSEAYDALRVLEPEAFVPEARAFLDRWLSQLRLEANGPIALQIEAIEVAPVGNAELPRISFLTLSGVLPEGAQSLQLHWPKGAGEMVLRQQGVEDPFTGFLLGGMSTDEISLTGGNPQGGWTAFDRFVPLGFAEIVPNGALQILTLLAIFFMGVGIGVTLLHIGVFSLGMMGAVALGALGLVLVPGASIPSLSGVMMVLIAAIAWGWPGTGLLQGGVILIAGLLQGAGFVQTLGERAQASAITVPETLGYIGGVQIGILSVTAAAYLLVGWWGWTKPWYARWIARPGSGVIGVLGFWTLAAPFF